MSGLPQLGVGVSYRPRWRADLLPGDGAVDCLEIIAEHYLEASPAKRDELENLRSRYPLAPHGIGLSLGTDAPLDARHLRETAQLVERAGAPWFSEHLSFTGVPGHSIGHLAPLPFTWEAVAVVSRNVRHWRQAVGVPLLLENIAYLVRLPGELTEAEFIGEVLERTDCGLLLDLHNLYADSINHGGDPLELLDALPLERVVQIHLAGGHEVDGCWIDSHARPVPEDVWRLLAWVAPRAQPKAVVIEWDTHLPDFGVIRDQLGRARAILGVQGDDVAA